MDTVVFLDRATLPAALPRLARPHTWTDHDRTAPEEVAARIRNATVVISNKVRLPADVLAQAPGLKVIGVPAAGLDHIDTAWCRDRGIPVLNCPGYADHTVPEHAICLAMVLRRSILPYHRDVQAGRWQQAKVFFFGDYPVFDLFGATLGIVGHGNLGRAMGRIGQAFGMEVLVSEHKGASEIRPGRTPFDEVLARADILSLHAALTPQSAKMIGAAELARMKPSAVLINTARGGLIDEPALAEALRAGRIAGAGLDSLSAEPPVDGNPLLDPGIPNLLITPHVAWLSDVALRRLAEMMMGQIAEHLGTELVAP